ncbi:hypothetical protein MUY35_01070 [Aliiroseovarius sp. S1339]|uniref:hypothetical protein n=1 Tax=Aliiroseovarius sp. S1339 TaxID=2936990 RepID=UPI0020BF8C94|nr:hypothetical protein [Aliiroseovarius sp. S1339]MCK8462437.1 hypothetical protein [Aliiroseovarius sp. S1339]
MTDNESCLDVMRWLGPGGRLLPSQVQPKRSELTYELQKYMHILGPTPKSCLATLADLGLSDPEIARYFKVPKNIVTDLRQVWNIDGEA